MSKHLSIAFLLWLSLALLGACSSDNSTTPVIPQDGDTAEQESERDSEAAEAENVEQSEGEASLDGDKTEEENTEAESEADNDSEAEAEGDGDLESEAEEEAEIEEELEPIDVPLVAGCNPFALSEACALPFPSFAYETPDEKSATGVRLAYPADLMPGKDGFIFDVGPLNRHDGASPAATIMVHLGAFLTSEQLIGQHEIERSMNGDSPLALFDFTNGTRLSFMAEMDNTFTAKFPNHQALLLRPLEPMTLGARHVVALTTALRDESGQPFAPPLAFLALRDRLPTTNPAIEALRGKYEEIFTFLAQKGYPRESLLLAWDFAVASRESLFGPLLAMRNETLAAAGFSYTIDKVTNEPNENVARLIEGQFYAPSYLNADNRIEFDENGAPLRQKDDAAFPFTLLIPAGVEDEESLPLIVFGHGVFGSGRGYLTDGEIGQKAVQPLAKRLKAAVIATDWIGLSEADYGLLSNNLLSDFNRIGMIAYRLQQSLINQLALTELACGALKDDPAVKRGHGALFDTTRVYYYGVSLGGIMGASFVGLSDRIDRAVFTVPGAGWSEILPRSFIWTDLERFYFAPQLPDPLVRQLAFNNVQALFDPVDGVNLARLLLRDPLPNAPARSVLMQEGIGDAVVPNIATEILARTIGLPLVTPAHDSALYGLASKEQPFSGSGLSQYELPERTSCSGCMPPTVNHPPSTDNGVHGQTCFLPQVIEQAVHFLDSREVVQYCDGPCNPD